MPEADVHSSGSLRIGVFGGTFDPPHSGHVGVVTDVADHLNLDHVRWVTAGHPPHKRVAGITQAGVRHEMVAAATEVDDRFRASDVELERTGPSYTVDTLAEVRAHHPDATLFLIMGADQFRALDEWRQPGRIVAMARLAVIDRGGVTGASARPPGPLTDAAVMVPVRRMDVSSTQVRLLVEAGASIDGLVPPGVAEIIVREHLYGSEG